jgi:hypothetical protein
MTVSSATNKSGPYLGNGTTTVFAYDFRILDASHISVIRTEAGVDTVLTTGFTVSGVGNDAGNVTFAVAPTTGQTINLIRNAPFTQQVDLENQGAYYAETVEQAFDLAAMRDQQLQEQINRSVKIPVGQDSDVLDDLIEDVIRLADSVDEIDTVAGIAADVVIVAGVDVSVVTVAGIAANVTTVAGISGNVTAVAGNNANVTTVAGSISSVNTVGSNISNVNSVAGNIAAVQNVDANMAAVIAAPAQATAAAGSASAALASANAAADSYDQFDDRYLGAKSVAPTVDNDGNPLIVGTIYWDTPSSQMFTWNGTSWRPAFLIGNTVRTVVTATAGQTVVPAPTYLVGSNTLQVFVNGVKLLLGTDYTETTQNSITFATGLSAGDEVELIAQQAFAVDELRADLASDAAGKGAALVAFKQSGTGSVPRTVDAKLKESVSVKDFGAVGDGVADDTAAFQAAADYGGDIEIPPGSYRISNVVCSKPVRFKGCGAAFGSSSTPLDGTTAIYLTHTSGVGIKLDAAYSGMSGCLIRRVVSTSGTGLTAIQTNAPLMQFEDLRIVHHEISMHGAALHFYMTYRNVWQSGTKMLVNAPGNNAVLYDSCIWSGEFEIHNAISVSFVCCDFSDSGNPALVSPYTFINPISVSIDDPYTEARTNRPGVNWFKFFVDASGIASGAGRTVSVSGGYFRGESTYIDTAYLFDGPISVNMTLGYYRDIGYVAELANGATFVVTGRPRLTGGAVLMKNASSAGSGLSSYGSNQLRFGSDSETPSTSALTGAVYKNTGTDVNMDGVLAAGSPIHVLRKTSQGTGAGATLEKYLHLYAGSTLAGEIGIWRDSRLALIGSSFVELTGGTTKVFVTTGAFGPAADNATTLGVPGQRWSVVYAATGTINTSDAREKQQVRDLTEAERAVAVRLKSMIRAFKFNEAVAAKGDGARIHVGVIAQDVKAAFEAEGLVAEDYAILCFDQWPAEIDDNGVEVTPAGERYGVRYEELLAFILAAL